MWRDNFLQHNANGNLKHCHARNFKTAQMLATSAVNSESTVGP